MTRKPRPVPDERIAAEIAGLDAFLDAVTARQLAMYALGARQALQWVRDTRQPDPMNPLRMIALTEFALDLPRVIPFKVDG
jgi:hypothetical protein